MTAPAVSREQAFAAARAVLDRARVRIARDRAAGRLAPEAEFALRRIEREQAARERAAQLTNRAA
jgi:hypothetical protein